MSQGSVIAAGPLPESPNELPRESEELGFKPITPLAPLALFFGICSVASIFIPAAVMIPAIGLVTGLLALIRIHQFDGEMGGKSLALVGTLVSGLFLVSSGGYHAYRLATEVPEGYERLSFAWLAKQEPIKIRGKDYLPPEVTSLDGRKVYVKGYMYPTGQLEGLKEFILVKDTEECCFGGKPKVTDKILIKMQDGLTVDHQELILVGIGGVLRPKPVYLGGEVTTYYTIEGTHFR